MKCDVKFGGCFRRDCIAKKQCMDKPVPIPRDATNEFKINTPQFLKEVFNENPQLGAVLKVPANVLRMYLLQIAERASELNDPKLNAIMCQMALYEIADPYSPEYDAQKTDKTIRKKYD